jgi:CheY-like chemotaxis protein
VAEPVEAMIREVQGLAQRGSETVLVVEDDAAVRALVCKVLREFGYNVLGAEDGNLAVGISGREQGPISLLVTDVGIPGMDGHELARRLRETRPALRVLFLSGYALGPLAHRRTTEDGVGLLPKPFTPEALARRVRETLDA